MFTKYLYKVKFVISKHFKHTFLSFLTFTCCQTKVECVYQYDKIQHIDDDFGFTELQFILNKGEQLYNLVK